MEHTGATTEKYKMDETYCEESPDRITVELPCYSPSVSLPKRSCAALKRLGQKLDSPGWGDYGMEKDYARIVADAIRTKTKKLNDKHFETNFTSNELIVEDVSHVSILKRLNESIELLRKEYASSQTEHNRTFDKIHLITEHSFVYDVFGNTQTMGLREEELTTTWQRFAT